MFLLDFLQLLWRYSPRKTLILAALMVLGSLTDGIGLVLILPVIAVIEAGAKGAATELPASLTFLEPWANQLQPVGLIAVFLAVIVFRAVLIYLRTAFASRLQLGLVKDLRLRCAKAVLNAQWQWLGRQQKAHQISLIFQQIQRVSTGVNVSITLLTTLAMGGVYLTVAFLLSPPLTGLAVLVGAVVWFFMRGQHGASSRLGQGLNQSNKQVQAAVQETLEGLKQTKIFGNEQQSLVALEQQLVAQNDAIFGAVKINARAAAIFQSVVAALLAVALLLGMNVPGLNFATLVMFLLIVTRMAPLIMRAQTQVNNGLNAWPAFQEISEYLTEAALNSEQIAKQDLLPLLRSGITIKDLSWEYEGAPVLAGISCEIPAHKTTLISGASGVGKSTLADILMGLLVPKGGDIYVDGLALGPHNLGLWRASVSYVPQDVYLRHDSIRGNLLWAKPDADESEIKQALTAAAADFVWQLPLGLETVVGDGGQRLSGGERQRLVLARALLRKPQLLILDEATNALDRENETAVLQSVAGLRAQMTIVVIAHGQVDMKYVDHVIHLGDTSG